MIKLTVLLFYEFMAYKPAIIFKNSDKERILKT